MEKKTEQKVYERFANFDVILTRRAMGTLKGSFSAGWVGKGILDEARVGGRNLLEVTKQNE